MNVCTFCCLSHTHSYSHTETNRETWTHTYSMFAYMHFRQQLHVTAIFPFLFGTKCCYLLYFLLSCWFAWFHKIFMRYTYKVKSHPKSSGSMSFFFSFGFNSTKIVKSRFSLWLCKLKWNATTAVQLVFFFHLFHFILRAKMQRKCSGKIFALVQLVAVTNDFWPQIKELKLTEITQHSNLDVKLIAIIYNHLKPHAFNRFWLLCVLLMFFFECI